MKDSTLCPRFEKGMKFLVNDGQHSLFTNFSLDLSAFVRLNLLFLLAEDYFQKD